MFKEGDPGPQAERLPVVCRLREQFVEEPFGAGEVGGVAGLPPFLKIRRRQAIAERDRFGRFSDLSFQRENLLIGGRHRGRECGLPSEKKGDHNPSCKDHESAELKNKTLLSVHRFPSEGWREIPPPLSF